MADQTTTETTTETKPAEGQAKETAATSLVGQAAKEASSGDQSGAAGGGDGAEGAGKGDDKGDGEVRAPEQYADFVIPEAYTLDGEDKTSTMELFKSLDLTQEKGQELIDWYTARESKRAEEAKAQAEQQRNEQVEKDLEEVKADPDLGGAKLKQTSAAVGRAMYAFDVDGSLGALLEEKGLGNKKAIVKFLAALGSQIKEDVGGDKGGQPEGNPLESMYPSMFNGS